MGVHVESKTMEMQELSALPPVWEKERTETAAHIAQLSSELDGLRMKQVQRSAEAQECTKVLEAEVQRMAAELVAAEEMKKLEHGEAVVRIMCLRSELIEVRNEMSAQAAISSSKPPSSSSANKRELIEEFLSIPK